MPFNKWLGSGKFRTDTCTNNEQTAHLHESMVQRDVRMSRAALLSQNLLTT